MREFPVDEEIGPVLLRRKPADMKRPMHYRLKVKPNSLPKKRVERPVKLSKQERLQLNTRQQAALKNWIELGMGHDVKKEAGTLAGYSPTTAVSRINNLLTLPIVQNRIQKALVAAGVDDKRIAEVIAEGFEALHPLAKGKKDFHAIHKFVHEANLLHNNFPPTKIKVDSEQKILVVNLTREDAEAFMKYKRMRGADSNA